MIKADSLPDRLQRYRTLIVTALSLVTADQLSKLWVRHNIALGNFLPREGILRLTHNTNTGGVFGLFPEHTTTLIAASAVLIVVLLVLHHYLELNHPLPNVAFGLILGGAVGNLIDRIWLREVTDFIAVRLWRNFHWPPFNFADSAVVIGTIILVCSLIFSNKFNVKSNQP